MLLCKTTVIEGHQTFMTTTSNNLSGFLIQGDAYSTVIKVVLSNFNIWENSFMKFL